jgi:hypothetical protein
VKPRSAPGAAAVGVGFGAIGGALASAFMVLPATFGGAGRLADYAGTMVAMLAVFFGGRALATAHPGLDYARRAASGVLLVATESAIVGVALYWLYAHARPALLEARYAALAARVRASGAGAERVAAELARMTEHRAQYLDPAYQALATAGTLAFFGCLLALWGAWRWRVARRLPPRPGPDRR